MKKDVAEKWVAALRSGDYTQGFGKLRNNDDGYCCLGVLCDILDPEGWRKTKANTWAHRNREQNYLPASVQRRAGLSNHLNGRDPAFSKDVYKSLSNCNDDMMYSFTEIADVIERAVAEGNL